MSLLRSKRPQVGLLSQEADYGALAATDSLIAVSKKPLEK